MEMKAFHGWRYRAADGDVSDFIAPPYDVLSQADKDVLLSRDRRNIVAVDLPYVPPKDVGPDECYGQAAHLLDRWKSAGLLVRDDEPAVYVYEQTYDWAGRAHTRRTILCVVRATEFGRDVIAHEKTFAGPRADRLKLTEYTRMQLSPIFGFYDDPNGAVSAQLETISAGPCDISGTLDGLSNRLWTVRDAGVIGSIASSLRAVPLFIADGHHRYTTALNYRDSLGDIPPEHPANFVMFAMVAADDPGLLVLPTHRLIKGLADFDLGEFAAEKEDVIDFEPVRPDAADLADADAYLRPFGRHAMLLAASKKAYVARPRDVSAIMKKLAPGHVDTWRELDVAILHRLMIDDCLAGKTGDRTTIDYTAEGSAAFGRAMAGEFDLAVLLQATPIRDVKEIAIAGDVMPHKSTYFYPKLATGMVLYGLD